MARPRNMVATGAPPANEMERHIARLRDEELAALASEGSSPRPLPARAIELAEAAATAQALAELLRFARPEDKAAIAALDREQGSALATLWSGFRQEEPVNAV